MPVLVARLQHPARVPVSHQVENCLRSDMSVSMSLKSQRDSRNSRSSLICHVLSINQSKLSWRGVVRKVHVQTFSLVMNRCSNTSPSQQLNVISYLTMLTTIHASIASTSRITMRFEQDSSLTYFVMPLRNSCWFHNTRRHLSTCPNNTVLYSVGMSASPFSHALSRFKPVTVVH